MNPAEEMEQLLAAARQVAPADEVTFAVAGRRLTAGQVMEILTPYITARRLARIDAVLAGRTFTVATVVEGLVNTGNVSAVMRSAEGLGFQPFYVVTGDVRYKTSTRTSQGAEKWLDVWTWPTPAACATHLKTRGYTLVATHLDETAVPIDEIDFTRKTALIFGNERDGVSEEMLRLADRRCIVPMTGFTQSFNISVAAAVSLYHAYRDRLTRQGRHGDLSERERETLRATFCLRSVKNAGPLLRQAVSEGS